MMHRMLPAFLLLALLLTGLPLQAGTTADGWTFWSPREEATPDHTFNPKGGRDGKGSLVIEAEQLAVSAGSTVFIPGSAEHGIRNTGDEPLRFFYAFAVGSFADIEYRFTAADG